jgi:hypothetical protein
VSEECLRFFVTIEASTLLSFWPSRLVNIRRPRKKQRPSCFSVSVIIVSELYRPVLADSLDFSSGNHTPPFIPFITFYYLVKFLMKWMEYSFVFHLLPCWRRYVAAIKANNIIKH